MRENPVSTGIVDLKDEEHSLAAAAAKAYYQSMAREFERLSTIPLEQLSLTERERWLGIARGQIRDRARKVRRD
jgi:hypothetical protein